MKRKWAISLAGLALTPLASAICAQTANDGNAVAADSKQLQAVKVTGSAIPQIDVETASPVQTISSEDIQRSGYTTVSDVVHSISAANSGSIPNAFANGFSAGGSGIALRGLTVDSTLVLIDGHRNASYAAPDDGQRSFVDLNTLPLAAVDHIEILKDGASALYGADAIAGVVNIILKPSYRGVEGSADVGTSTRGGGLTHKGSLLLGGGDLQKDGYNAYVGMQYEQDDPIWANRRSFPYNTKNLSGIGGDNGDAGIPGRMNGGTGAIVAPGYLTEPGNLLSGAPIDSAHVGYRPLSGCASGGKPVSNAQGTGCEQNLVRNYGQVQSKQQQGGIYGRFTKKINDTTTGYISASYFQNKLTAIGFPRSINTSTPFNTNNLALPPRLADGSLNPYDPWAAQGQYALINYRFGDIRQVSTYNNHNERVVMGLSGEMGEWNYDAALVANHTFLETDNEGFPTYGGLEQAIKTGSYDFAHPDTNSRKVRKQIAPGYRNTGDSNLDELDFSVNRELWDLPGGPAAIALGTQARHESQNDPSKNPDNEFLGVGQSTVKGNRNVAGGFFEFDAPLMQSLEMDLSGRFDHYSDFGNHFTPKVGLKWKPLDWLALRGTFSKGLRAPSFAEGGSSSSLGFTTTGGSQFDKYQKFIQEHGGGSNPYLAPYNLANETDSNRKLKPESARSYTFGVVLQPTEWLTTSVDYFNIKKTNVITTPDTASALDGYFSDPSNGPYEAGGVEVIPDTPDPAHPGAKPRPARIVGQYINANSLKTTGIDVDITSRLSFHHGWQWISELNATDIFTWAEILPDGTRESFAGTHGPYNLSSGAGTPKIRGSWANTLLIKRLAVTGTLRYTSGMTNYAADNPGGPLSYLPTSGWIGSFTVFDLTGSYALTDQLTLTTSVMNVFDRKPPFDPGNYGAGIGGLNYNPSYAQEGIVGRFVNVGVKFKL